MGGLTCFSIFASSLRGLNQAQARLNHCINSIRISAIENDASSAMNTKEKLLNILLREKELPAKMKTKIDERVETFWEGITNDAGLFLHENLDDKKHTQEEVKALVQCVPGSLSCRTNARGKLVMTMTRTSL